MSGHEKSAGGRFGAALPMTVVTGYLGAGKTTFVNSLLAQADGYRITVLVNDFGEISLDETLIAARNGDVISLANGCMCCQIGGDLYRTIDRILLMKDAIDHLVVETSGVADPSKISQIAKAEPELELSGTLVVVDAENLLELYGDPVLKDTLERQIRHGDLLLLNKHETASETRVADALLLLRQIAPDMQVAFSMAEMVKLVIRQEVPARTGAPFGAVALKPHKVPFDSWSWQGKGEISEEALTALLGNKDYGIYRAKGILKLSGGDEIIVNKVGEHITVEPFSGYADSGTLTVIGKLPGFDRARFARDWEMIVGQ